MSTASYLPSSKPLFSDPFLVDNWRVAHPGVYAWSHVSAITATRIGLILASCAAAAADLSVAPLETDHRMVSATFGELAAFSKHSLLWRMHPSVLADDEAYAAVRSLRDGLLDDYVLWLNWDRTVRQEFALWKSPDMKTA